MYEKTTTSSPKPIWADLFDKIISDINDLPQREQVELFKALQSNLFAARKLRQEAMEKELEAFAADVKAHAEGTNVIASGL